MRVWPLLLLVVSVATLCVPDTGCCFNNTCLDCSTCICEAAGGIPLENGVSCVENRCACFDCAPLSTPTPMLCPTPTPVLCATPTPALCPTPVPCPAPVCPIPECPSLLPPLPLVGALALPLACLLVALAVGAVRRRRQSVIVTTDQRVIVPRVRL